MGVVYISLNSHEVTGDFHHGHRVTGSLTVWSCGHRQFVLDSRSSKYKMYCSDHTLHIW